MPCHDSRNRISFQPVEEKDAPQSGKEQQPTGNQKQQSIITMKDNLLAKQAEVMWAVEVVMSKHSFRSCDNKSDLFSAMFSDSNIAKSFACGQTKCKYLICFGIAPYFKELLNSVISELDHVVCQFDESHNDVMKKGQMDLHVRYCDSVTNTVITRYYSSEFLGKAASKYVLEKFKKCMPGINEDKLLQVSMNGPQVNTSFIAMLNEDRRENELTELVSIGTCSLHTS